MPDRVPTVFISSTSEDLKEFRAAAQDAAIRVEFEPILIERFEGKAGPPVEVDLHRVASADVLVVIVAHRYGWVPDPSSGRSMIWLECERAVERRIPVFPFMVDENQPWPPQFIEISKELRDFKNWLASQFTVTLFKTPDDLAAQVTAALARWRWQSDPGTVSAAPPTPSQPITLGLNDESLMPKLLFRLVAGRHAEPKFLNDLSASLFWDAVSKAAGSPQIGTLAELLTSLEQEQQGIDPNPLWLAWVETARREEIRRLLQPPAAPQKPIAAGGAA